MNGKDEQLLADYYEEVQQRQNDAMFASMANHLGEALRGTGNGNSDSIIERTLLAMQSDIRIIREELCKLTSRVDIIEQKQLFEVIERKPTNETNYSTIKTESSGGVMVEL